MAALAKEWVANQPQADQAKVLRLVRHAGIQTRHTVQPLAQLLTPRSLGQTMALYRQAVVELAEQAVTEALQRAHCFPHQLDCLISTSCTGYMAPSLDAFLVQRLGCRPTVLRLPVTAMGCAGGAAALVYAEQYLRANPGHTVAVVSAELCSLTFQPTDFSWANVVSAALFADGAACALFGPTHRPGLTLQAGGMAQLPQSAALLGFDLTDTGFRMVLDPTLPSRLDNAFESVVQPFLHKQGADWSSIQHWVVHPGGRKILDKLAARLTPKTGHTTPLASSYAVLEQVGNLSSPTVLFILQQLLRTARFQPGDRVWLGAFGPGLTTVQSLLQWQT